MANLLTPPASSARFAPSDTTLAALFARTRLGMRYDLRCMHALLQALGAPHRHLKVVMVAGTNGKGSTSALLAATLRQAGLRCGLFTSPHLVHFRERVVVDGATISDRFVAESYGKMCAIEHRLPRAFTFFEATVAMACMAFAAAKVDVAVMEAGLGGRLDATNIFADHNRLACVLTRVDVDHAAILGPTPVAIAKEKAALWRGGTPAVSAPQTAKVGSALAAQARRQGVNLYRVTASDVRATAERLPKEHYWPAFMQQNAAVVRCTVRALQRKGLAVKTLHWANAVRDFSWPGRYQRWQRALEGGRVQHLIVDGGHNPAGCRALARALRGDPYLAQRPLVALIGALADKDIVTMVSTLQPLLKALKLCPTPAVRSFSPSQLQSLCPAAEVYADVDGGLRALIDQLPPDAVGIVAGSLTLVGAAIEFLRREGFVPVSR